MAKPAGVQLLWPNERPLLYELIGRNHDSEKGRVWRCGQKTDRLDSMPNIITGVRRTFAHKWDETSHEGDSSRAPLKIQAYAVH